MASVASVTVPVNPPVDADCVQTSNALPMTTRRQKIRPWKPEMVVSKRRILRMAKLEGRNSLHLRSRRYCDPLHNYGLLRKDCSAEQLPLESDSGTADLRLVCETASCFPRVDAVFLHPVQQGATLHSQSERSAVRTTDATFRFAKNFDDLLALFEATYHCRRVDR